MPDLRAILVSLGVGLGIAAYTTLWWHWPLAVGGGVAIVMGGLALVGTLSIGTDPAEADAAWRAAAPEFVDPPEDGLPEEPEQETAPGRPGAASEHE